jgi:hypothetical protein
MFAEKAASLDSTNSAYMVEVGYQYLLRARTKVCLCKGGGGGLNKAKF